MGSAQETVDTLRVDVRYEVFVRSMRAVIFVLWSIQWPNVIAFLPEC